MSQQTHPIIRSTKLKKFLETEQINPYMYRGVRFVRWIEFHNM